MKARSYCSVFGCLNNNSNRNLTFFSLPKDIERRRKWLTIIDRQDLLEKKILKRTSYLVCSAHFEDSSIKLIRHLQENAVPTINLKQQFNKDLSCSERESTSTEEEAQTSNSLIDKISRKRNLSKELKGSHLKHRRFDQENTKIKKEEAKNILFTCNDPDDEISWRFQRLIEWQKKIKNKYKWNRYDAKYKVFSLKLHISSPHAYTCLQRVLKLPCKSTLNRLNMNIPPKFENQILESLSLKIKSLPNTAKYCTICVDEMTLKRNLYYSIKTDKVIGFHNVNETISPEIAGKAFAIMLQGIYFKWKQPVAYAFLASAKNFEQIDLLMNEIITKLSSIGIKVKAIVSDQGSNFDKFAKEVKKVTVEKPYFMYNNTKVYYVLDAGHLIKCIRNNLLTSDFFLNGKTISWYYLEQLYKDQKERNLRLLPKFTDAHIQPNKFQKTVVKLAVQTLSRSVSTALHTYIDLGKLPEEARPTADFIELMNDLFDILNSSKIKCSNKFQTAFRLTKSQQNLLNDANQMFAATKAINHKTGKNTRHIKSFVDFQISMQSITLLFKDLKKDGFDHLLTRRLNQENFKKMCSLIRQGSCSEPTPIQFRQAFSKLFLCNMLESSPNAISEMDISDILLKAEDLIEMSLDSTALLSQKSAVYLKGDIDYRMELPDENKLTYISSYLFFKCINEHTCPVINDVLKSVPDLGETNMFKKYKDYNKKSSFYGSLRMPPKEFVEYVQKLETVFNRNFHRLIQNNPGGELLKLFKTIRPQTPCSCFPVYYLLKLFTRFRIFSMIKFNNRYLKDDKKGIKYCLKINHL